MSEAKIDDCRVVKYALCDRNRIFVITSVV